MVILFIVLVALVVAGLFFTSKIDKGIEQSFSPSGKLTTVSGGIIHWHVKGKGPNLVLIHGLLGNSKNFGELADILSDDFTVYSIDRPGSGFSSRYGHTSATFEQQSKMIIEWMDKENIDKAALVGHSMGGGISLRLALDAPSRISSVSLLCPLTTPLKGGAGPLTMLYIPNDPIRKTVSSAFASPLRVKFGQKQVNQIFHPEAVPDDFAVNGGGILALHSRSFYEGSRDTVSAQGSLHRQKTRYNEITCPVGVLYGQDDAILDPDQHTRAVVDKLPNAKAHTLKGAGHMIPITQPGECAEFIKGIVSL
jgi:pimeloyl-ACP methyl ester carboxylesterase